MQIEQAIYTSIDKRKMKGYQLVSQSRGIDRTIAQELCRWAPSHASLSSDEPNDWSLNYFPVVDGRVAITRTVYGGPEYSDRGGIQIVTMHLVLHIEQFANFDFDAVALAKTALTLGYLRLPRDFHETLPTAELPRSSFNATKNTKESGENRTGQSETGIPSNAVHALLHNSRVAVIGTADPLESVAKLVNHLPLEHRAGISFSTGLKPSARRKFQLQFLPPVDRAVRQQLNAQGIDCVSC